MASSGESIEVITNNYEGNGGLFNNSHIEGDHRFHKRKVRFGYGLRHLIGLLQSMLIFTIEVILKIRLRLRAW